MRQLKILNWRELVRLVLADTVIIFAINYFSPMDWTTVVAIYISTIIISIFSKKKQNNIKRKPSSG